jgi:hypothetical protein
MALEGENAGLHLDMDVPATDARKLYGQHEPFRILSHISDRHPAADLGPHEIPLLHDAFEEAVKAFL